MAAAASQVLASPALPNLLEALLQDDASPIWREVPSEFHSTIQAVFRDRFEGVACAPGV